MKIHLLVAHPEATSFNFALHQTAVDLLNDRGAAFTETNLYALAFNPVAGHSDVEDYPSDQSFNLAKAQRWALANDGFVEQIQQEQDKLQSSDVLILQFPLWWWSFPAILKGWIDRVLSSGFAYGNNATLNPKKIMYSITTGGASNQQELDYYQQKIDGLYQDVFGFMGWQIIPPFVAHGVQQKNHQEREALLVAYQHHLSKQVLN